MGATVSVTAGVTPHQGPSGELAHVRQNYPFFNVMILNDEWRGSQIKILTQIIKKKNDGDQISSAPVRPLTPRLENYYSNHM